MSDNFIYRCTAPPDRPCPASPGDDVCNKCNWLLRLDKKKNPSISEKELKLHELVAYLRVNSLADGELECLKLLTLGYSNAEIKRRLKNSPSSVDSAISRVYTKLGIDSRVHHPRVYAARAYLQYSGQLPSPVLSREEA